MSIGKKSYEAPQVAVIGPASKLIREPPDLTLLTNFDDPLSVREAVEALGYWASKLELAVERDRAQKWITKIPIIILANAAGLLAALHVPPLFPLLCGFIVSCLVTLDGILNPGKLLNSHARTLHDLRNLQIEMTTEWRTACTEHRESPQLTAEIIRRAEKKRRLIADRLRDAETMTEPGKRNKN